MELVAQKKERNRDFVEDYKKEEMTELRERLMQMEMHLQMQKTTLEEAKEMARHEALAHMETIEKQQKTINDLILQNRLYEASKTGVRGFLDEPEESMQEATDHGSSSGH